MSKKIAVDFDGTLCEYAFPKIGNQTPEQKELLERFRKIENEKSNPSIKKFFQKAKSFWNN